MAVIVGIDSYNDQSIKPLRYAMRDASRVAAFFEHLNINDNLNVRLILNKPDYEIINTIESSIPQLGRGDLLMFYFAGHGVQQETTGQHLLLCDNARHTILQSRATNGAIAHSYLDDLTRRLACDCLFCLDACRMPLLRNTRSTQAVMKGSRTLRDIGAARSKSQKGVCWTIWSCEDQHQAEERDDLDGGLFTASFINTCHRRFSESGGIIIDESFMGNVLARMQEQRGGQGEQQPAHTASPSGKPLIIVPTTKSVRKHKTRKSSTPPLRQNISAAVTWWIVSDKGEQTVSKAELRDMIRSGKISRNTEVWREGLESWTLAGKVEELKILFPPERVQEIEIVPPPHKAQLSEYIELDCGKNTTMKLKLIPSGEFMMGSPDGEGEKDEHPQHKVQITQPFYTGIYPVTQAQYRAVTGMNPSYFKGENLPVECISWSTAVEFCQKLSDKEDKIYRLPTEAQWEYACRAGTTTRFYFGDNYNDLGYYAWFSGNSRDMTHPVGKKKPNAFGLYDMHGNVWEWCSDWYDKDYYSESPEIDPCGPNSGNSHVIRGGSWFLTPRSCCSANRFWRDTLQRKKRGFRIMLLDF